MLLKNVQTKLKIQHTSDEHFENLIPSLKYLEECNNIKHKNFLDWTVAKCINKPVKQALKVRKKFKSFVEHPCAEGDPELKKAIVNYFKKKEIFWCENENIIINNSVLKIIDDIYSSIKWSKKDYVLIPIPAFGYYVKQCNTHGIKTKLFETTKKDGWRIKPKKLDKFLKENLNIKVFLFNNPVNPTGVAYTKEEVTAIANILKKYNILVISDEVFFDLDLNKNKKPYSIGAVNGMKGRVIVLNGVGKTKGLSSICISFGCIPKELARLFPKVLTSTSLEAQKIATVSLLDTKYNQKYKLNCIKKQNKNIGLLSKLLKKYTNGLANIMIKPEATNVIMLSFKNYRNKYFHGKQIKTGLDLAQILRDNSFIATVPGEAFFLDEKEVGLRISTSYPKKELKIGIKRIANVLQKIS